MRKRDLKKALKRFALFFSVPMLMSMLSVSGCETGECARTTHPVPGGGVLSGTSAQRGELSAGHRL